MNIIFMGSPDFAIPSLEKIHSHPDLNVVAVVSNVDKRRGRGGDKTPTPVKAKAVDLGIDVIEVEDLKSDEFEEQIKALEPDLLVVVAFRILPKNILAIPKIGSINLHASLLPKYRGAAPIHWAIMNGESITGCTIFFLDEQVDTGNIILQSEVIIGNEETTGELYDRMKEIGSVSLLEAIHLINKGDLELQVQNDEEASPAPKIFREDTKLSFDVPAIDLHNKIRGLSPFPTAWALYGDEKMNIYRSKLGPISNIEPGELLEKNGKLLVGCKEGTVEILELQLPGKKRVSAEEFIRGYGAEGFLK